MNDADLVALIAGEATSAFVDARLIDGIADEPLDRGFVRIRERRIAEVGPMSAFRTGRDERVVDLAGHTLLPGLIDCHVHFVYSGFRSLEEIDRCPVETATINAIINGGRMLNAGYTTVRDVGTIGNAAVAIRDAIAAGKVRGPRVIASGQIIGPSAGMTDTLPSHWSKSGGLGVCVDGPQAIVKEVRRQIRSGVDNIKLGASGVEVGLHAYTWMTTLSAEEIAAAVAEAHRWGRTVAIHCQSFDAAKFALRAGADTIEHGTRLDEEALALFAKSRTALVPTLSTLFSVLELGETLNLLAKQRAEMAVNKDHWLSAVARACRQRPHRRGLRHRQPISARPQRAGNRVPGPRRTVAHRGDQGGDRHGSTHSRQGGHHRRAHAWGVGRSRGRGRQPAPGRAPAGRPRAHAFGHAGGPSRRGPRDRPCQWPQMAGPIARHALAAPRASDPLIPSIGRQ